MILSCAAVLFDVDGTLVDSTPLIERAAREWGAEYGIDPDEFLSDAHGRRTGDRVADFLPADQVADATARLEELEAKGTEGITALPGAVDLLANMSGLPYAFVTSMDRAQLKVRSGVAGVPLPQVVVTAEDVPDGKPDPSGYRQAARRLGVDPSACVVIEDAPAGVAAGRAAGATVVAVLTSHPREALTGAHHIVDDLTRVTATPSGLRVVPAGPA
ncbi:HAD-IA family hydrolase [Actinomadura chibensis]|uniref:HAD-IA family hydrolase n=1 Tax=Actinomadura chibensis TaxID=392828 RepID=A0A5D0NJK1_9ACTN|nr:HAD-IA family hydrolase [Actinomadura chibensis]TYB44597.1 HAD-IA family hydrolase [Actinomadura chibensis]